MAARSTSFNAEQLMRLALAEAAKGIGRTHPNPAVGAVLAKGSKVLAVGHHERAGGPHAEQVVLAKAGSRARGADLYTTLEPCNHYGRTPPCSEAILAAGVKRVFCASADPNPLVDGKGVARLRRAGVTVVEGVLKEEADEINRPFFKYVAKGLPWVALKAAVSLDGQAAAADGSSQWITGAEARHFGHHLRDQHDCILVGAGTVERDNPRLTTRLKNGRDPVRVVVDSRLRVSPSQRIFTQRSRARTIVATLKPPSGLAARAWVKAGVDLWSLPSLGGRVNLEVLLLRLAEDGLRSVLVEGGPKLHASFLGAGLADWAYVFIAPKLLGSAGCTWTGPLGVNGIGDAYVGQLFRITRLGSDALLEVEFVHGRKS